MITADEARAEVDEIRKRSSDDEAAHSREDDLRERVLAAIARGMTPEKAAELARVALSTRDIEFCRWSA